MSETTPRPWQIRVCRTEEEVIGFDVCAPAGHSIGYFTENEFPFSGAPAVTLQAARANAVLASFAPDLLEICERMAKLNVTNQHQDGQAHKDLIGRARSILDDIHNCETNVKEQCHV